MTSALLRVLENPRAGTICTFPHAELSGIRRVPVAGFRKRLIFYQFRGAEILVLRVLHGARDLESLL